MPAASPLPTVKEGRKEGKAKTSTKATRSGGKSSPSKGGKRPATSPAKSKGSKKAGARSPGKRAEPTAGPAGEVSAPAQAQKARPSSAAAAAAKKQKAASTRKAQAKKAAAAAAAGETGAAGAQGDAAAAAGGAGGPDATASSEAATDKARAADVPETDGAAAAAGGDGDGGGGGGDGGEALPKRKRAASLPKLSPQVPPRRPAPKQTRNSKQRARLARAVPRRGLGQFGKVVVRNRDTPPPMGCCSQAIRARGMVFVSGTVGSDKSNDNKLVKQKKRKAVAGEPEHDRVVEAQRLTAGLQTRQAMRNIQELLEGAGSNLSSVLQYNVQCINMKQDFADIDAHLRDFFVEARPARTVTEVAALPRKARVQIDCQAMTIEPTRDPNKP